jgi:sedoheptulokinase
MSVQNAAGWGYFNTSVAEWNSDILQGAGFPTHLLPHVVKSGAIAGTLNQPWYGIPSGTPVGNVNGCHGSSFSSSGDNSSNSISIDHNIISHARNSSNN